MYKRQPWIIERFSVVGLQDFGPREVECFIDKWSRILSRIYGERSAEVVKLSLDDAVKSNPRVRSLAGNPMVLTILAVLNESRGGNLPRRRVDLYEKIADVFLDSWERCKRSQNFAETHTVELDSREFEWLLASVALLMQREQRVLAPKWWLRETISEFLIRSLGFEITDAKDLGESILRYLTQRTGLIEELSLIHI